MNASPVVLTLAQCLAAVALSGVVTPSAHAHDPSPHVVPAQLVGVPPLTIDDPEISFELVAPASREAGEDLVWTLTVTNDADAVRTVNTHVSADSIVYNGNHIADLTNTHDVLVLAPGATESVTLVVPFSTYLPYLDVTRVIAVIAGGQIEETGGIAFSTMRSGIAVEDLRLEYLPRAATQIGESRELCLAFTNTLPIPLTDVVVRYSAAPRTLVDGAREVRIDVGDLAPGQTLSLSRDVVTSRLGTDLIGVVLSTSELGPIADGLILISVIPADVDGNGVVDNDDLLAVFSAWGPCPAPLAACFADVDGNGVVESDDLLAVIEDWGWKMPP